jgi:hypothetical protein
VTRPGSTGDGNGDSGRSIHRQVENPSYGSPTGGFDQRPLPPAKSHRSRLKAHSTTWRRTSSLSKLPSVQPRCRRGGAVQRHCAPAHLRNGIIPGGSGHGPFDRPRRFPDRLKTYPTTGSWRRTSSLSNSQVSNGLADSTARPSVRAPNRRPPATPAPPAKPHPSRLKTHSTTWRRHPNQPRCLRQPIPPAWRGRRRRYSPGESGSGVPNSAIPKKISGLFVGSVPLLRERVEVSAQTGGVAPDPSAGGWRAPCDPGGGVDMIPLVGSR